MSAKANTSLHHVITSFLTDVDSVRSNSVLTGLITQAFSAMAAKALKDFLDECAVNEPNGNMFVIPIEKLSRYNRLRSEHNRAQRAKQITSRAFIVSLISQYDAFLSSLVRSLYKAQPGLINSSNKTFTTTEILAFGSIEDAKNSIMDDEIESLLRDSHHEQFAWLEKKFDIKTLRKDLKRWPIFVEVTQRRNLFVHTDGKVSKQYIKICSEHKALESDHEILDKQLEVDSSYVRAAADVLAEISVKLTQVLWRKVLPDDLKGADQSLTDISYDLIVRKRYQLAIKLLDFGFETIKRYSATDYRLRFLVNRANAYRLLGQKDKCHSLIAAEDWSACDQAFRLASEVLTDKFDAARSTMKRIGDNGSPSKTDYREWPLFSGFRENASFQETFREIFDEDVAVAQVIDPQNPNAATSSLIDLIDSEDATPLSALPS